MKIINNDKLPTLSNYECAMTILLGVIVFLLSFYAAQLAFSADRCGAGMIALPLGICAGVLEQYLERICICAESKRTTRNNDHNPQ